MRIFISIFRKIALFKRREILIKRMFDSLIRIIVFIQ